MELADYVQQVRDQLTATAALGDARTQEIASSLASAAAPAVQLALLSAVADAAEEITAALLDFPAAPTVTTRWEAGTLHLDVASGADAPTAPDEGEATARISLRLTDALKTEVDAAAAREGVSVNTWLARAAFAALRNPAARPRDVRTPTHRVTGWING